MFCRCLVGLPLSIVNVTCVCSADVPGRVHPLAISDQQLRESRHVHHIPFRRTRRDRVRPLRVGSPRHRHVLRSAVIIVHHNDRHQLGPVLATIQERYVANPRRRHQQQQ